MSSEARTVVWTVEKQKILTVPTQSGIQVETGDAVTVSLDNFDSAKLTLDGVTSATEPGNYVATVTPKANYCWSDGSTDTKNINWTLSKNVYKIMTVVIDESNSNPETSITYANDAATMTAGSSAWDDFFGYYPVMLKEGAEVALIDPEDYTKSIAGTTLDITSGDAGDVMVAFPKRGLKLSKEGDIITISMTDNPDAESAGFKYYAHSRGNVIKDKFYLGAYKGSNVSSKLRSLSGKSPAVSQNIGAFRNLARANNPASNGNGGSGYDQSGWFQLIFRQCMYLLKYKNLNSQSAVGMGWVNKSAATATGGTNTKGLTYGESAGTEQMKLFGIEDFWGNVWEWIDGLVIDGNRNALTATQAFNSSGTGYTNQGNASPTQLDNYPWTTKVNGTTEKGFIATAKGGSATTYYCDLGDVIASRVARFGGGWDYGSYAGAFYLDLYRSASTAYANFGARLMYL